MDSGLDGSDGGGASWNYGFLHPTDGAQPRLSNSRVFQTRPLWPRRSAHQVQKCSILDQFTATITTRPPMAITVFDTTESDINLPSQRPRRGL